MRSYNECMAAKKFTPQDVSHIAQLAQIPVTEEEQQKLAEGFTTTITVVDQLFDVDVKKTNPMHQVTNLENVFREDEVDPESMLSQDTALSATPRSHNGFFVVDQIREEK